MGRPTLKTGLIATGLALAVHPAAAQVAAATTSPVSPVVVTATRLPQDLATTPDAYVITVEDIQATQATFASQALVTAPGVSVSPEGPYGLTGVSIRGATTDKTLALIDGMPVNDASQPEGGFDFGGLDLYDVARIEVLTGPQAALWGSDAIGGVVAMTTKEPNGVSADFEGGSLGWTHLAATLGESAKDWALGATVSDIAATGVSAADPRNNYAAYGGSEPASFFPAGYRGLTLGARGRIDFTPDVVLDAQARYTDTRTDIGGYPAPDYLFQDTGDVARSRSLEGYVRLKFTLPFDLDNEISASGYKLQRGDEGPSVGVFGYTADREVYRWTISRGSPTDPVSFEVGAEREDSRASLSSGAGFDLGSTATFGIVRWRPIQRLTLTASGRWDDPDKFKAVGTGRIAASLDLAAGFSLTGSAGQGYKTPTISETACDFCTAPPIHLEPEHAFGYDAGLAWRSPDGRYAARVALFDLTVSDQIEYVTIDPTTFASRYENITQTHSRGIEASAEAVLPWGFRLQGSYTYDDARNDQTGSRLLRMPLNTGSASLMWSRGKADAAFTLQAEGDQSDTGIDGFTPVIRPGFLIANLAGGYALTPNIRLTARIENVANSHYEAVYGYGEPGRTLYIGLHLRD
jgi:vitamin B12 transporter